METTLATLMVLGIFVGIPAIIGFAIAGVYIMRGQRVRRGERAEATELATEAHGKTIAEKHIGVTS